jgi:hypothetical protein
LQIWFKESWAQPKTVELQHDIRILSEQVIAILTQSLAHHSVFIIITVSEKSFVDNYASVLMKHMDDLIEYCDPKKEDFSKVFLQSTPPRKLGSFPSRNSYNFQPRLIHLTH